jgi:hypothetical protein
MDRRKLWPLFVFGMLLAAAPGCRLLHPKRVPPEPPYGPAPGGSLGQEVGFGSAPPGGEMTLPGLGGDQGYGATGRVEALTPYGQAAPAGGGGAPSLDMTPATPRAYNMGMPGQGPSPL